MNNIDRAAETMREADRKSATDPDINRYCYPAEYAQALADATPPLLMPDPQIIRTVEELEDLHPETVVWPARHYGPYTVGTLVPDPFDPEWTPPLPAVVVSPAAQVLAALKALEEA